METAIVNALIKNRLPGVKDMATELSDGSFLEFKPHFDENKLKLLYGIMNCNQKDHRIASYE